VAALLQRLEPDVRHVAVQVTAGTSPRARGRRLPTVQAVLDRSIDIRL
jgi:hypothetical protein